MQWHFKTYTEIAEKEITPLDHVYIQQDSSEKENTGTKTGRDADTTSERNSGSKYNTTVQNTVRKHKWLRVTDQT